MNKVFHSKFLDFYWIWQICRLDKNDKMITVANTISNLTGQKFDNPNWMVVEVLTLWVWNLDTHGLPLFKFWYKTEKYGKMESLLMAVEKTTAPILSEPSSLRFLGVLCVSAERQDTMWKRKVAGWLVDTHSISLSYLLSTRNNPYIIPTQKLSEFGVSRNCWETH